LWVGILREQLGHAVHAPAPSRLELVKGLPGPADRIRIGAHELLPSAAVLGDQAGPLQHRDVLLHGGEAHRICLGQPRHRRVALGGAAEDVTPGSVRQGVKYIVDCLVGHTIYNHLVVG